MEAKNILVSDEGRVRVITVNRPDALNALNRETLNELREAMLETYNQESVDVVIITGAGEKSFVAGADIAELSKENAGSGRQFALFGQEVFNTIEHCPKPVIAAVNGFALGGGCELALACHMRIASENAKFGQPEVNLGIIPGYGGTQRLPRIVGQGRANELILTGNIIDAQEAHRIGLANHVVPRGEALKKAMEVADLIGTKGQVAVEYALLALSSVPGSSLQEGLQQEAALFGLCCGSEDFKEGTSAFLEKRKPDFKGK